jgi:DNA-binding response OmpR family regulator
MRRILVVDDDLHVCLAIEAWLGRHGLAVADGGTAGLVALDNSIFDLVTLPVASRIALAS